MTFEIHQIKMNQKSDVVNFCISREIILNLALLLQFVPFYRLNAEKKYTSTQVCKNVKNKITLYSLKQYPFLNSVDKPFEGVSSYFKIKYTFPQLKYFCRAHYVSRPTAAFSPLLRLEAENVHVTARRNFRIKQIIQTGHTDVPLKPIKRIISHHHFTDEKKTSNFDMGTVHSHNLSRINLNSNIGTDFLGTMRNARRI